MPSTRPRSAGRASACRRSTSSAPRAMSSRSIPTPSPHWGRGRPQTLVYYRDVYDHLLRITDLVDTHRDLLTGAMEIYLTVISNRLNEVVKVLTVITALLGAGAVITGFYGMNFERTFPPFAWRA